MLILTRKVDQQLVIGDGRQVVWVKVIRVRGDMVTLGIQAPHHVRVDREEVRLSKDSERAASSAQPA